MSSDYNMSGVLFPAYAGVIPVSHVFEEHFDAFPRVCGGDPL